jgi:hypothetical protein
MFHFGTTCAFAPVSNIGTDTTMHCASHWARQWIIPYLGKWIQREKLHLAMIKDMLARRAIAQRNSGAAQSARIDSWSLASSTSEDNWRPGIRRCRAAIPIVESVAHDSMGHALMHCIGMR